MVSVYFVSYLLTSSFHSSVFLISLALFGSSIIQAESLNLNCWFTNTQSMYSCQLVNISLSNDVNQNIVISGNHLQRQTNADVQDVFISRSTLPFLFSQIFTTFPNLISLRISMSQVAQIQPNAFRHAVRLHQFVSSVGSLRALEANAFTGATNLNSVTIWLGRLESVHETAFEGCRALRRVQLDENEISEISANLFGSSPNLERVNLFSNRIQSLSGRTFVNNPRLVNINLEANQIESIGRQFLDGLDNLEVFNMRDNRCVRNLWMTPATIDEMRQGLEPCFVNYERN